MKKCKFCKSDNLIMKIVDNKIGLYCINCNALLEKLTASEMRKLKMLGYEIEGYY